MDINKTEALIARMKYNGWDITANAYKYAFPGVYVSVSTDTGTVFVSKGAPQINLDLARRIAEYLNNLDGIEGVVVEPQLRNGDITVRFDCADFNGFWSRPRG